MRFALVSDAGLRGGAGIAAGRLASALVRRGHDVHWVTARRDDRAHEWHSVLFRRDGWLSVLNALAERAPVGLRRRLHAPLVERPLRQILNAIAPDVVSLHNVHGAGWQPAVLNAAPSGVPVLWTLHDMWSMTGRCACAYDCRQFLQGCTSACPTSGEYPALEPNLIAASWAARGNVLRRHPDIMAIAPSRWLAHEAKAGLWRQHQVAHIPNGVPVDVYFPVPRDAARQALGLDTSERVVAVMAENLSERRKGWTYLQGALERLREPRLRVLLIGSGGAKGHVPSPHAGTAVGPVESVAVQRLLLSAAECLVHPAPVHNLPNVVLEALACGRPTVAFPVGGLPDMVRPGSTGWLAVDVTPVALAAALAEALSRLPDAGIEDACRQLATTEFGMELQARRYEQLIAGQRDDIV